MPLHGVYRATSMRQPRQGRLVQIAENADRVAVEGGIETGDRDVQFDEAKPPRGNENRVRSRSDDRTGEEKRCDHSILT